MVEGVCVEEPTWVGESLRGLDTVSMEHPEMAIVARVEAWLARHSDVITNHTATGNSKGYKDRVGVQKKAHCTHNCLIWQRKKARTFMLTICNKLCLVSYTRSYSFDRLNPPK